MHLFFLGYGAQKDLKETTFIHGHVYNINGLPLENVKVTFEKNNHVYNDTLTDEEGYYGSEIKYPQNVKKIIDIFLTEDKLIFI
jgi:hypothetical protein